MGSSVAAFVWRDVVGKRWIRCGVWQCVVSSVIWLLWEFVLYCGSRPSGSRNDSTAFFAFVGAVMRFLFFQASQMFFLLGQMFISEPEESNAASFGELGIGLIKLAWRSMVGRSRDDLPAGDISYLRSKIRITLDYIMFAIMCVISGSLAFISLLSSARSFSELSSLDLGFRGASLGLVYAGVQFYYKNLTLSFPIIQRRCFFAFKMGLLPAANKSLQLTLALVPVSEVAGQVFLASGLRGLAYRTGDFPSLVWQRCLFTAGAFFVVFCWEVAHHLTQVLLTKHHVFAPPLGSTAAETDPTDLLLLVLENPEMDPLAQYHAFLDLCIVSETNVDTWWRAAFFEETGDTYKRLIAVCLKRLDNLTLRLAQGVEVYYGDKGVDLLKAMIQSPQADDEQLAFQLRNVKSYFNDFQLCMWSARTVASLTSNSRLEDKYGVAQLHGCNVSVISSLLSCLLVVEFYLGTRSIARGINFISNSIQWTVPCRGTFMELGKKPVSPFRKGTMMHKKAYAMADILRTSIYHIVSVFGEDMVQVGSDGKAYLVAERDWLSQKNPLFGSPEMHLQKLRMFLEHRVG